MRAVGYITDGKGRRIFALVPVDKLERAPGRGGFASRNWTEDEEEALAALFTHPAQCLEAPFAWNPIRAAREAAGITQAELAFVLEISQPMLSRQEQAFRRVRPASVERALQAIRRIRENRSRPVVDVDAVLASYGKRLAKSAARKPRDPVERRLLREAGDPIAQREREEPVREAGQRRRPPARKPR